MDRTGIYGRFNLDGAPVDPREAALLGLALSDPAVSGAGRVIDLADPGAAQVDRSNGALTLLLGRLDEPDRVAARLGMAADTPQASLARAALDRFGGDVRHLMAGEWTLLHYAHDRVTLAAAIAQRDPLLFAYKGSRLAIGPDLRQLGTLDWVDSDLDDAGLLFALGRQELRAAGTGTTVLRDVRALEPGGLVVIDRTGCDTAPRALPERAPRWRGSFEEALAETQALLDRIVRQRMWGGDAGCLLSGGLDSSSLTWLVARNRDPGTPVHCLTSAAAPGSGLVDETPFANIVADHLRLPIEQVVPAEAPGIYRPEAGQFRDWNGPRLGPRHYLYHAFAEHMRALQAPLLFDGQFGEYTITSFFPLATMRERLRDTVRRWRGRPTQLGWTADRDAFHVFLAQGRTLPTEISAALAIPTTPQRMPAPGELWGLLPSFEKMFGSPAAMALGRVRVAQPYRDPRLLTFFSGLPAGLLQRPGLDRAPVRELLKGHLPDSIRLRPKGLAISPDYSERLKRQAPAARARIAAFRAAEAGEWLDLDRLDTVLERVATGNARSDEAMQAQLTAMAAEFVTWWRGGS